MQASGDVDAGQVEM